MYVADEVIVCARNWPLILTQVAHSIIDGGILTDRGVARRTGDAQEEFKNNANIRLDPDSIAEVSLPMRSSIWSMGNCGANLTLTVIPLSRQSG